MDERTAGNLGKAGMVALSVAYLYQLVVAIWKAISARAVEAAASEIVFLVVVMVVFTWAMRDDERLFLPRVRSFEPEDLLAPTARRQRLISYASGAAGLAAAMLVVSVVAWFALGLDDGTFSGPSGSLSGGAWFWVGVLVVEFVGTFAVFFLIDWWWGESKVKRYVRTLKELEA